VALGACGDGLLDLGETCDDGNLLSGDCCSATCASEAADSPCPDDGNPCSQDVCDASGTCTHPTGGQASCDDGDACTTGDACSDGVCAGTPIPAQCIDAVVCYHARSTTRFDRRAVGVDDQFAVFAGPATRPRDLCLPASTGAGPLNDPATALVNLQLKIPGSYRAGTWRVTDQFGSYDLTTRRPDRLLVASATGPPGSPIDPPPAGSANHYTCRQVRLDSSSVPPGDLIVTVDDALGSRQLTLGKPDRLCSPSDLNVPGTGMEHRRAHLLCYDLRHRGALRDVSVGTVHTANMLDTRDLRAASPRALCVPAVAEETASPCRTGGDECGLPCCRTYPGQHADCSYAPVVASPRYLGCAGPTVLVDRSHVNFHQVTPESPRDPGRFWGFAKLLVSDGYVVRDTRVPFAQLLPTTTAKVLVVANPRSLLGQEAMSPDDVAALVAWVENGGSLLLSIDHPPFEKVGALLTALGLERSGLSGPPFTFTRASGDLNGQSVVANGSGPASEIDEVTTFRGTAFSISPTPPSQALHEPVLTYPLDIPGQADGLLQGVTIEVGAGRVYVSGESGGLTAQDGFGMQFTPENEQYLLNILHWLDF
jgi:cysteine-rich repeat protein